MKKVFILLAVVLMFGCEKADEPGELMIESVKKYGGMSGLLPFGEKDNMTSEPDYLSTWNYNDITYSTTMDRIKVSMDADVDQPLFVDIWLEPIEYYGMFDSIVFHFDMGGVNVVYNNNFTMWYKDGSNGWYDTGDFAPNQTITSTIGEYYEVLTRYFSAGDDDYYGSGDSIRIRIKTYADDETEESYFILDDLGFVFYQDSVDIKMDSVWYHLSSDIFLCEFEAEDYDITVISADNIAESTGGGYHKLYGDGGETVGITYTVDVNGVDSEPITEYYTFPELVYRSDFSSSTDGWSIDWRNGTGNFGYSNNKLYVECITLDPQLYLGRPVLMLSGLDQEETYTFLVDGSAYLKYSLYTDPPANTINHDLRDSVIYETKYYDWTTLNYYVNSAITDTFEIFDVVIWK